MKKIKYIIRCIFKLDFKNMFKIINKLSKKSGKSKIYILFDVIYCGLIYGAGYYDYQEFEFYKLSRKERKTYLTRTKNNLIIKKYNNKNNFYLFDNKVVFNDLFKKYLNRDYLVLDDNNYDDFKKFTTKHKKFIVKPINGEGGRGVDRIEIKKDTDLKELYLLLIKNKQLLLEEYIIQNSKINKLYDGAVNTLRIFTFYDGKDAYVLNTVFKIGNGGCTDNFSSGSMYTFLDDKGVVCVPAIDKDDKTYEIHPITNNKILGFKVPFFDEACNLVCDAAKIVEDVKYVGWDVAITNDGAIIVEGNCYPGVFQIKPSFSNHIGLIPKYKNYMDF